MMEFLSSPRKVIAKMDKRPDNYQEQDRDECLKLFDEYNHLQGKTQY